MNTFLFFDDFIFDHYRGVRRRHFKPQPCGDFYIPGMTAGSSVAVGDGTTCVTST